MKYSQALSITRLKELQARKDALRLEEQFSDVLGVMEDAQHLDAILYRPVEDSMATVDSRPNPRLPGKYGRHSGVLRQQLQLAVQAREVSRGGMPVPRSQCGRPYSQLRRMIGKILFAVSAEESRFQLNGALIKSR